MNLAKHDSRFISSAETPFCKYVMPSVFLLAGLSLLYFGQRELGVVQMLISLVTAVAVCRMQRVELSQARIRIHRFGEDVWIDYQDVSSIEQRTPMKGYEAAVLNLSRDTPVGRRIWFLLERRYLFGGPLLRNRPLHPTVSSMRTLCAEAREESPSTG